MVTMAATAMVHEYVHERAGQQEQPGQGAEQMSAVLECEQDRSHCNKSAENPSAGAESLVTCCCFGWCVVMRVVRVHELLPVPRMNSSYARPINGLLTS